MSDDKDYYWHQRYNVQADTLSRLQEELTTKIEIIERQRNDRIQDKKTITELRESIQTLKQELEKRHSDASTEACTIDPESSFRVSSAVPRSTWPNKSQTYETLDSQWKSVSKSTTGASYPVKAQHVDPDDDFSDGSVEMEEEVAHLFEEFFIVGVRLVNPSENNKAEILLQFPSLSFTAEKSAAHGVKRAALADFCFPDGIKSTEIIRVTEDPDLPNKLCEEPDLSRSDDVFVFCMKVKEFEHTLCSMELDQPNKDKTLVYGVCVKFQDVLVIGKELWLVPKCFCLITYYACFELHHRVLTQLRKIKRLRRLAAIMKGKTEPRLSRGFRQSLSRLPEFDTEEMSLLTAYFSYGDLRPGQQVVLSVEKLSSIMYQVPALSELDTRWCCSTLFSALTLPDLMLVLAAVMCEKSVVFVSERLGLLTSCVLGVVALMRPFVWQHLLLPVVPSSYQEVLDAPIPVLVGLPKKMGKIKPSYSHILWVKLDPPMKLVMDESVRCEIFEPHARDLKSRLTLAYSRIVSRGQTYPSSEELILLACDISKEITDYWERILKKLPLETPMDKSGEFIDEEQIIRTVIAQFDREDHLFLSHFLRSQTFFAHVQDRKVMSEL